MKKFLLLFLLITIPTFAITIETFKSKNPSRFDGYGVVMHAKIHDIDCNYQIGYGANQRTVCRTVVYHKYKGHHDGMAILYFNRSYQTLLSQYMNSRSYGFISCTYAYKSKRMGDCSLK